MRNTPLKAFAGEGEKKDKYKKIIKDHGMKKDDKGFWVDSKGRTPSQIAAGVPEKEQRSHKLPASNKKK